MLTAFPNIDVARGKRAVNAGLERVGNLYVDCSFGYYEWTIYKVVSDILLSFDFILISL